MIIKLFYATKRIVLYKYVRVTYSKRFVLYLTNCVYHSCRVCSKTRRKTECGGWL